MPHRTTQSTTQHTETLPHHNVAGTSPQVNHVTALPWPFKTLSGRETMHQRERWGGGDANDCVAAISIERGWGQRPHIDPSSWSKMLAHKSNFCSVTITLCTGQVSAFAYCTHMFVGGHMCSFHALHPHPQMGDPVCYDNNACCHGHVISHLAALSNRNYQLEVTTFHNLRLMVNWNPKNAVNFFMIGQAFTEK